MVRGGRRYSSCSLMLGVMAARAHRAMQRCVTQPRRCSSATLWVMFLVPRRQWSWVAMCSALPTLVPMCSADCLMLRPFMTHVARRSGCGASTPPLLTRVWPNV